MSSMKCSFAILLNIHKSVQRDHSILRPFWTRWNGKLIKKKSFQSQISEKQICDPENKLNETGFFTHWIELCCDCNEI